jgi:hypothetical protein
MSISKTIILVLLSAIMSFAANHYVSNNGTASWAASTNIVTPCSTRVAFDSAQAGDTAFFLQGTYNTPERNFGDWYLGYYYCKHDGTSGAPIVFMRHSSADSVVFNGTAGGSGDHTAGGTSCFATLFATNDKNWIVFDGFKFLADEGSSMARVMVGSNDRNFNGNVVIKNCVFDGGVVLGATDTDNREGLLIHDAVKVTVQNCYFYNYLQVNDNHNTSAIKAYHDTTINVTNCEITNCTVGIYWKGYTYGTKIQNCYVHDCNECIFITPDDIGMEHDYDTIYNCVITYGEYAGAWMVESGVYGTHGNDFVVYNNTFYGNTSKSLGAQYCESGHGLTAYNNIIIQSSGYSLRTVDMTGWRNYLKAVDHNQWGATFSTIRLGDNIRNTNYTSLANWQASSELEDAMDAGCGSSQHPGCGDLSSDPQFVNTSGNMNELADFALGGASPCLGAGRSGADIGADVSTVGIDYEYAPGTQYTLTMANDGHGTTTPSGAVVLDSAEGQAISASPSGGYVFANWSVTAGSGVLFNGDSSRCSLTVSSATVQANFETAPEVHADSNAFIYNNTHYTSSGIIYFPILVKATIVKDTCKTYLKNAAGTIIDSTAVLSENERDTLHGTFAAGTWKLISKTVR